MRKASFMIFVEDTEEGNDRITLEFTPIKGDQDLMLDVIHLIVNGGKDPEFREVLDDE